jgi:hypothetical protein
VKPNIPFLSRNLMKFFSDVYPINGVGSLAMTSYSSNAKMINLVREVVKI